MQDLRQLRCQPPVALLLQILRHAVKRLGDAAGDSSQRVAVTAEGDRRAESVFKICAFQKRRNSLRHGLLTALHMMIGRTDLVAGAAEIIFFISASGSSRAMANAITVGLEGL